MSDQDGLPDDMVRSLLSAMGDSAAPDPLLRARVLADAVLSAPVEPEGIVTVRDGDEGWSTLAPGVMAKVLYERDGIRTWLARLERGAELPAHIHVADEECLVLEGTVMLGGVRASRGDYQIALAGSRHDTVTTDTGCLLFLRSGRAIPA